MSKTRRLNQDEPTLCTHDTVGLGWKHLANADRSHYFDHEGRSLCGLWMSLSRSCGEHTRDYNDNNCCECGRKVKLFNRLVDINLFI